MKKCLIVGGSKGIGAAICKKLLLLKKDYEIYILDINRPIIENDNIHYIYFDLFKDNIYEYSNLILDSEILIITAGIGQVKFFEDISKIEINKIINVNLTSIINLLSIYYQRLLTKDSYCLTMGSIAGEVCSPLFSVYGAAKAGLNKFIESINIELEYKGVKNRICNVIPTSFEGSSFNGGETNLDLLYELANSCLEQLFLRKDVYYPNKDLCENIISRYIYNKNDFGKSSLQYKLTRISNSNNVKIGYLSGTFDLFHVGHLRLIERAKKKCDFLIVGVHKDASHKNKQTYICFEDRCEILKNVKQVDMVVESFKEDSEAWAKYKFDYLFVGSDYKGTSRFIAYEEFFKDKGVEIIYFPYTSSISSTKIRDKMISD